MGSEIDMNDQEGNLHHTRTAWRKINLEDVILILGFNYIESLPIAGIIISSLLNLEIHHFRPGASLPSLSTNEEEVEGRFLPV